MNRRMMLLGAAGLAGAGLAGTGTLAFRLHRTPRRDPFLTDAHLNTLAANPGSPPRILFIGNSMVLRNDLPAQVRAEAAASGVTLATGTAAADGARLIETVRIAALEPVLTAGWDAIVVQDFTKTPLRAIDRLASARAVAWIARTAQTPLLLYPPWPAMAGTAVYRDAGFLTAIPEGPEDYAARTMAFYDSLGHRTARVPEAWLAEPDAGAALYAEDGHHPNAEGTAFVARIIWSELRSLI